MPSSDVAIVGGGNSAEQAAVYLAATAAEVHLLVRRDLSATMSRYLIDQIGENERITVHPHTTVTQLLGEMALTSVTVTDTRTGAVPQLPAAALFAFLGAEPHIDWLRDALAVDEHGFILTGADLPADPALAAAGPPTRGRSHRSSVSRCRPAVRGCSPSGTSASAPSNASPPP